MSHQVKQKHHHWWVLGTERLLLELLTKISSWVGVVDRKIVVGGGCWQKSRRGWGLWAEKSSWVGLGPTKVIVGGGWDQPKSSRFCSRTTRKFYIQVLHHFVSYVITPTRKLVTLSCYQNRRCWGADPQRLSSRLIHPQGKCNFQKSAISAWAYKRLHRSSLFGPRPTTKWVTLSCYQNRRGCYHFWHAGRSIFMSSSCRVLHCQNWSLRLLKIRSLSLLHLRLK